MMSAQEEEKKEMEEVDDKPKDDGWDCTQCTLHNKATSKYCKVCKEPKPKYCWQWNARDRWLDYPQRVNKQIEDAVNTNTNIIEYELFDNTYIIDLTKMQQMNKATKKTRAIKRVQYKQSESSQNNGNDEKKQNHLQQKQQKQKMKVSVILNVYSSTMTQLAYHTGVKVHGVEYSYGNGISINDVPDGWTFYKQVMICRDCKKTKEQVRSIIIKMERGWWTGYNYNITKNNCNHFSNAFIKKLCGTSYEIPSWVNQLADMGSAFEEMTGTNVMDLFGGMMSSFNASNSSYNNYMK